MNHKVTLITRSSNAEEELMNYAEEADQVHRFLNTRRPQQIQAWNEVQFINFKNNRNDKPNARGRSLSVLVKQKTALQDQDFLQRDHKQQLKFKLRHYQEQFFQSTTNLNLSNDFKLINANKKDQKQTYEMISKTNGFQRIKKLRNFSISQPKQKNTRCDKTAEILPKTSRGLVDAKQRTSRPVKISLIPVTAAFSLYEEQKKLSLRLKQYIKRCSVTLNL